MIFQWLLFWIRPGSTLCLSVMLLGTIGNGRDPKLFQSRSTKWHTTHPGREKRGQIRPGGNDAAIRLLQTVQAKRLATPPRIMKEGRADAVHLEGTARSAEIVSSIVESGIPVLGHIGVTKQRIALSGTTSACRP